MTTLSPGFGAFTQKVTKRLLVMAAAGALALAGLTSVATPARSDTTEDLMRLLLGIAAIAIVVHAVDDRRTPRHISRWVLPDACMETVRVRSRHVDVYNARCLERSGYRSLPQYCQVPMRTDRGERRSFLAQCLYDAGYQREQRYVRPVPQHPHPIAWLPRACEMHYRQSGVRVAGYDGLCLNRSGFYSLPRQCRVSDRQGNHYYNADCLIDSGYRRAR